MQPIAEGNKQREQSDDGLHNRNDKNRNAIHLPMLMDMKRLII